MNTVNIVWYNNGESYEDNFENIVKIFDDKKKAQKFLKDMGLVYEERQKTWSIPFPENCPKELVDCGHPECNYFNTENECCEQLFFPYEYWYITENDVE